MKLLTLNENFNTKTKSIQQNRIKGVLLISRPIGREIYQSQLKWKNEINLKRKLKIQ